ncbi:MAG TPA: flagellin [Caulobacteraceae bacterium]
MTISVQNNSAAMTALQNLNRTTDQLANVQQEISTTLAVAQPKDNPAVWATAQGQKVDIDGLAAVTQSLNRASSISDVALSSGQNVIDLLNQMKQDALSASDPQLDSTARQAFSTDFTGLLQRINTTLSNASFDGANLLDGSGGDLRFLATADATQVVTLPAQNMSLGGGIITVSSTATISTTQAASAMMSQIDASISNVTSALANIGDQAKLVSSHSTLVQNLSNVLSQGMGDLINADTEADSARLAALNVQQQLGEQSLNVANSMPNVLLSLFR